MVFAVVLAVAGLDPLASLRALAIGAVGNTQRVEVSLLRATPLLLAGLGVALAFRAGLWNIGAEGQLMVGAIAVVAMSTRALASESRVAPLLLVAVGAGGGAAFALVAGLLRARRGVPEVISTILLNFVALELLSWMVQGPLREAGGRYPQSDSLRAAHTIAPWGAVPVGLLVGVALAFTLSWWLRRAWAGVAVRAAGLQRDAARAAGVNVGRQAVWVLAASGGLAGLAGAFEVLGSVHRLYEGWSPGYGFTAIAIALLARLDPRWVIPAALCFGGLHAGAESMERMASVPAVVSQVVQALVIVASVLWWRRTAEGA